MIMHTDGAGSGAGRPLMPPGGIKREQSDDGNGRAPKRPRVEAKPGTSKKRGRPKKSGPKKSGPKKSETTVSIPRESGPGPSQVLVQHRKTVKLEPALESLDQPSTSGVVPVFQVKLEAERSPKGKPKTTKVEHWLEIAGFVSDDMRLRLAVEDTFLSLGDRQADRLCNIESKASEDDFYKNTIKAPCLQEPVNCLLATVQQLEAENRLLAAVQQLAAENRLLAAVQQLTVENPLRAAVQQLEAENRLLAAVQQLSAENRLLTAVQQLAAEDRLLAAVQQLEAENPLRVTVQQLTAENQLLSAQLSEAENPLQDAVRQLAAENRLRATVQQLETENHLLAAVHQLQAENRLQAVMQPLEAEMTVSGLKVTQDDLDRVIDIWNQEFSCDRQIVRLYLVLLKRALNESSPLQPPNNDHHRLAVHLANCCKRHDLNTRVVDLLLSVPVPVIDRQAVKVPVPLNSREEKQRCLALFAGSKEDRKSGLNDLCEVDSARPHYLSRLLWTIANNFVSIWPADDECNLDREFNVGDRLAEGEGDMMNSEYIYFSLLLAFSPDSDLSEQEKQNLALLIDQGLKHKKTTLKIARKKVDWRDWFQLFEPGLHSLETAPPMAIPDDYTLVRGNGRKTRIKREPGTSTALSSSSLSSEPMEVTPEAIIFPGSERSSEISEMEMVSEETSTQRAVDTEGLSRVIPRIVMIDSSTEMPPVVTTESFTEMPQIVTTESSTEMPQVVTAESSTGMPQVITTESSTEMPQVITTESYTEMPHIETTEIGIQASRFAEGEGGWVELFAQDSADLLTALQFQIKEYQDRIDEQREDYQKLEEAYVDADDERITLRKVLEQELKAKEEQIGEQAENQAGLQELKQRLEETRTELESIRQPLGDYLDAWRSTEQEELSALRSEVQSLQEQLDEMITSKQTLQRELETRGDQTQEQADLQDLRQRYEEAQTELETRQSSIKSLTLEMGDLASEADTSRSENERLKQRNTELEGQITQLEGQLAEEQARVGSLREELETTRKRTETLVRENFERNQGALQEQIQQFEEKLKEEQGRSARLTGELETANTSRQEQARQLEGAQSRQEELTTENEQYKAEVAQHKAKIQQLEMASAGFDENVKKKKEELKSLEDEQKLLQKKCEDLEKKKENIDLAVEFITGSIGWGSNEELLSEALGAEKKANAELREAAEASKQEYETQKQEYEIQKQGYEGQIHELTEQLAEAQKREEFLGRQFKDELGRQRVQDELTITKLRKDLSQAQAQLQARRAKPQAATLSVTPSPASISPVPSPHPKSPMFSPSPVSPAGSREEAAKAQAPGQSMVQSLLVARVPSAVSQSSSQMHRPPAAEQIQPAMRQSGGLQSQAPGRSVTPTPPLTRLSPAASPHSGHMLSPSSPLTPVQTIIQQQRRLQVQPSMQQYGGYPPPPRERSVTPTGFSPAQSPYRAPPPYPAYQMQPSPAGGGGMSMLQSPGTQPSPHFSALTAGMGGAGPSVGYQRPIESLDTYELCNQCEQVMDSISQIMQKQEEAAQYRERSYRNEMNSLHGKAAILKFNVLNKLPLLKGGGESERKELIKLKGELDAMSAELSGLR